MTHHIDDRLAQVATSWALAYWIGLNTAEAVARRLNITDRHARRLIRDAKSVGYITDKDHRKG